MSEEVASKALKSLASRLEATGGYKVLRRLSQRSSPAHLRGAKLGPAPDVERRVRKRTTTSSSNSRSMRDSTVKGSNLVTCMSTS